MARTLLTEEEATQREEQEMMSESFEIELSKEEVINKVQRYYNDLLSEEEEGEYISRNCFGRYENGTGFHGRWGKMASDRGLTTNERRVIICFVINVGRK